MEFHKRRQTPEPWGRRLAGRTAELPVVREFLIKQRATFDNLIATLPFDEMAAQHKLGVGQIPAVFVFNRKGEQVPRG